jgi:hypothetical protein
MTVIHHLRSSFQGYKGYGLTTVLEINNVMLRQNSNTSHFQNFTVPHYMTIQANSKHSYLRQKYRRPVPGYVDKKEKQTTACQKA